MIRFGLVGIGGYGRTYVSALSGMVARGRAALASAVCVDPEREAESLAEVRALGARVYASFEELVAAEAGRTDLLCLPTPIHLHAPMAAAAMEAGFDVLIEKPVCGSLAEVDHLIALRDRLGRFAAVGFQEAYQHGVERALSLLAAHGPVSAVRVFGLWPRGHQYFARNRWAGRLVVQGRAVYDSPANNALAHFVHLALVLAGQPGAPATPRAVAGRLWRAQTIESFDTCTLRVETPAGVPVSLVLSHSVDEAVQPFVEVQAAGGRLTYHINLGWSFVPAAGENLAWPTPPDLEKRVVMLERVLDARAGRALHPCPLESARAHTEVIHLAHAHLPVADIPADRIEHRPGRTVVPGLERLLHRAHTEGRFLEAEDFAALPPVSPAAAS